MEGCFVDEDFEKKKMLERGNYFKDTQNKIIIVIVNRKYVRIWFLKQVVSRYVFNEIGVEKYEEKEEVKKLGRKIVILS